MPNLLRESDKEADSRSRVIGTKHAIIFFCWYRLSDSRTTASVHWGSVHKPMAACGLDDTLVAVIRLET